MNFKNTFFPFRKKLACISWSRFWNRKGI
jgi:hypothetical protein